MKLAQLLSVFPQLQWGDASAADVVDVVVDSRQVKKGSVFVALRGTQADGHHHLQQAINNGAVALVVEETSSIPKTYSGAVVFVASTKSALNILANRYFANPMENLFCVGITGTNGKTTVAYMIERVLTHFGWSTGVLGTIDHHLGERRWDSQLTTPDSLTLHRRMAEFVALGARAAVFEVSSHALDQGRVDAVPFSVGVFTSFSRDHLDYHKTMQAYFEAKAKLFSQRLNPSAGRRFVPHAILNGDDPEIRKVQVQEGVSVWWYGQQPSDFCFRILRQDLNGSLFHLSTPRGNVEVMLPTPGLHNVYNAVAAIAVALSAGASLDTAADALAQFQGAPGRLEKIPNTLGIHVFVDYAHTDDALRSVLQALRSVQKGGVKGRLICVFGCGGDRDRGKRPLMVAAACAVADIVVFTSDNPRSEDPKEILREMKVGLPTNWTGEWHEHVDRREGLRIALQCAKENDVILVAGKGHEAEQIVGRERRPFSDQKVMSELLREREMQRT